jgi:hypothetical protein
MGQSNWLIGKKKGVGLVRHPQLINMKQKQNNKDPQNKRFKTATKEKSQKLDGGPIFLNN